MKAALWLLVFFLAACTSLGGLTQKPEISLAGLELRELGLFEQRFALQLRVQNPNDVDLPITGLVFDVEFNGLPFAKGISSKAVTVPRMGEALLEVTATSKLNSVLRQMRELQKSGRDRLDYRIYGNIVLEGLGSVPFERKGDLQIPAFEVPRKVPPLPSPSNERT